MIRFHGWLLSLALVLAVPGAALAALQGSVFTYQGKLEQGGVAVEGTRNFRFRLFDAATGGVQIGSDLVLPAQTVTAGIFSVPLDFGLLAFNGEARFLEIVVDDNTLSPRQLVTSAPYALYALDGGLDYRGGNGIQVSGAVISAVFGTTPGTVAEGSGVIVALPTSFGPTQTASFNITGRARVGEVLIASEVPGDTSQPILRARSPLRTGNPASDRFRVDSSGGVVALSEFGTGAIPTVGSGARLMWYGGKAALRAGFVDGAQWDDANIGFGSTAFGLHTVASGNMSVAIGDSTQATGIASMALGNRTIASGTAAFSAGESNTCSGRSCIALGINIVADGDFSTAIGRRVSSGTFDGSFIWGDNSTNTPSANTAGNQFMVRAAGGVRLRTSANLATGCDLPAGSGVFACTSDRNAKHDFRHVDAEDVLLRVTALPVESWRYRGEAGDVRHLGPTAQDFHAAFGLGPDTTSIGLLDIDGVNLLAIQALAERTEALARKQRDVDALQRRIDHLEATVARIEAMLRR